MLALPSVSLPCTHVTGLLIHGMGGMGKTSLAVEACRLLVIKHRWNVYKMDLRHEMSFYFKISLSMFKMK